MCQYRSVHTLSRSSVGPVQESGMVGVAVVSRNLSTLYSTPRIRSTGNTETLARMEPTDPHHEAIPSLGPRCLDAAHQTLSGWPHAWSVGQG